MREQRSELLAHAAVVVAAVLFGTTFLVVKDAIEDVDPYVFLSVRFAIGAAVLLPFAARRLARPGGARAGLICGARRSARKFGSSRHCEGFRHSVPDATAQFDVRCCDSR